MKALVAILEGLGCENVRTYIQSGNAVFRTKRGAPGTLSKEIGAEVHRAHGFKPQVLLLDASELDRAIDGSPFKTEEGKALHFFFLDSIPNQPDLASLDRMKVGTEDFLLHGRTFYLFVPAGLGRSKLATKVEKVLGVPATARNWNTVSKLAAMIKES